ncbi:MAG: hypothetical protein C0501_19795 [Isosphaera sp.]|nr:hypothetical protein [Isosphaera sp.]
MRGPDGTTWFVRLPDGSGHCGDYKYAVVDRADPAEWAGLRRRAPALLSARQWESLELALDGVADDTWEGDALAKSGLCESADLWAGLIPFGAVTLLAGPPKAGKSSVLRGLYRAAAGEESGEYLGRPVLRARFLVETEEPPAAWAGFDAANVRVRFRRGDPVGTHQEWAEYVRQIAALADAHRCDVIVLDTFTRVRGLDENNAKAVTRAIAPLRDLVLRDLTVLLIHHTGRSGSVRGSTALEGAADEAITIDLVTDDPADTRRTLGHRGRVQPNCRLEYHRTPSGLLLPGHPPAGAAGKVGGAKGGAKGGAAGLTFAARGG